MFLDIKADFNKHIKDEFDKTGKSFGLIRSPHDFLPRLFLLQVYKSLLDHLDYSDVIYDKAFIRSFQQKF